MDIVKTVVGVNNIRIQYKIYEIYMKEFDVRKSVHNPGDIISLIHIINDNHIDSHTDSSYYRVIVIAVAILKNINVIMIEVFLIVETMFNFLDFN